MRLVAPDIKLILGRILDSPGAYSEPPHPNGDGVARSGDTNQPEREYLASKIAWQA